MSGYSFMNLLFQGIIFATLYISVKNAKYLAKDFNCHTHYDLILFIKFVIFYIIVHEIGRMFEINKDMIILLFIGRIVTLYLEVCDVNMDSIQKSCSDGTCMLKS